MNNKIKTLEELKKIAEELRAQGKKVVWANGCYDLLHKGHVMYLQSVKKLGDVLIVGLNSDESVRKLKGPPRPINPQDSRAEVLAGLECVDYVTIFNELNSAVCLSALKPHIFALGKTYSLETMSQEERKVMESFEGKVEFILDDFNPSVTQIIEKIKKTA